MRRYILDRSTLVLLAIFILTDLATIYRDGSPKIREMDNNVALNHVTGHGVRRLKEKNQVLGDYFYQKPAKHPRYQHHGPINHKQQQQRHPHGTNKKQQNQHNGQLNNKPFYQEHPHQIQPPQRQQYGPKTQQNYKTQNDINKQQLNSKQIQNQQKQQQIPKNDDTDKQNESPGVRVYNCPKDATEMNCLSCATMVYRECPIMSAIRVTEVHLLTEFESSQGSCEVGQEKNYGFKDTSVWVNDGCRATFIICYEKPSIAPTTVNCMSAGSQGNRCPMEMFGRGMDIKVLLLWDFGQSRCKENQSWGHDNRYIWVNNGCSGTFRVIGT